MPGPRLPTDVIKARGAKHLSKAEELERRQQELNLPVAEKIIPPKWLGKEYENHVKKELRSEFKKIGKQLSDAGIFTDLDFDTLAQYVVSRHHWEIAAANTERALSDEEAEIKDLETWSRLQDRFFNACRRCANDLGLTITSRCRLKIPQAMQQDPEPEDDAFMSRLRERQRATEDE